MAVKVIVGVQWMTEHQGRSSWIVLVLFCPLNPFPASKHVFQTLFLILVMTPFWNERFQLSKGFYSKWKLNPISAFVEYHDFCCAGFIDSLAGSMIYLRGFYRSIVNFSPRGHLGTMKEFASASCTILDLKVLACGKSLGKRKISFWIDIPRLGHSPICKLHSVPICQANGLNNWVRIQLMFDTFQMFLHFCFPCESVFSHFV